MQSLGIAERGPTLIELDRLSSELDKPYGIITADCSSPHEYDDGIAITPLPTAVETYHVRVFAADTSPLYADQSVTKEAIRRTESRYEGSRTRDERYEPMLERHLIDKLHFVRGKRRSALVVSFIVGVDQPPSGTEISFGEVEVTKNYNYSDFGYKCRYSERFEPYARAAALILSHLCHDPTDQEAVYRGLIHVPKWESFKRGSDINQAYMVAANHLVGALTREQGLPAIYRTHDMDDVSMQELMSPKIARYSTKPGVHNGLGLDVYSRVTSPLRRVEDFIMHGLLRARYDGRPLNSRDHRLLATAVQRLNQRVAMDVFNCSLRMSEDDLWLPSQRDTVEAFAG